MEPHQRMLPPGTSAVNIELSLNHRRKDLPADSISAIQVKHDASVSLKLPLFKPTRYRSEAFVSLFPSSPSALETTFVNSLEHVPSASASASQRNNTVASRASQFTRGALKSNGEECNECVSDHSKCRNDKVNCESREPEAAQCQRLNLTSNRCGSEEKALKKQKALDRDTTRHCSSLQRQCRVQFENGSHPVNDQCIADSCLVESRVEPSSLEVDRQVIDCRQDHSHGQWNPINELRKFIEEEKEQQNLPNDDASKEPCEQLETSTDSVESGCEVNPLWVLDSITASVEKCNSPAYDTIFEEEVDSEIVVYGRSDGTTQHARSNTFGEVIIEEISGASGAVGGRKAPLNQEEKGENKRLSQGSDGSFGFESHYEEDFSGYVEGKEYFKNLPTFHRLLTSAEKKELDDEQSQKKELAALRLEDQIPGLHEQSDYAQDMMDTHAMRTEYWDYPYPSRSDAFDTAMGSEDKSELLENMRMKIRGRLRQPGNSSSDSGCQDTDANHSSIDETEATNRIHSPKGHDQEQEKTQTHETANNPSADCSEETEKEQVEEIHDKEVTPAENQSSNRRQILEGLIRLIATSEETSYSLPGPEDSNLESDTQNRLSCIGSQSVDEAPTLPARPMTHGQLTFVRYENITIVKKRLDEDRNIHEDRDNSSGTPSNTHHNKQSSDIMYDSDISKTDKDNRVVHTINEESVAEPIDINLSDPDVLEATRRMQLAFRKRRGPNGSIKFRSLQRMRAESDSVSDGGPASFGKHNPFPGDVSMESCEVQMSRHHSLPPNFSHSLSECNLSGGNALTKNKDISKERVCKKLSRQKSVSQYEPLPPLLTETRGQKLIEFDETNQPINKEDQRIAPCETANESGVVSAISDVQESSHNLSAPLVLSSSTNVSEMVKPNYELAETAEGEDVDKKLKCISDIEQQPINTSQCAQICPVSDTIQEPDIDLKDPKVQDASKMIQQAFRRKKLFSKRSRGSVEEKACKRVQANRASSGNAASISDTPLLEETQNAMDSKRSSSPSIIYADTTVNVVTAEVNLDKHTILNGHKPMNNTENSSSDILKHSEATPVITPAPNNCQTYKGVTIVNDKLSNYGEGDSKPPSLDGGNIIQADANANFRSSFEKSDAIKRASSISEVSLGDDIDIDLLDAEVQAVTNNLRTVSFDENSLNEVGMQDQASTQETGFELEKQDTDNQLSSHDPQSHTKLTNKPPVKDKVNETSNTNEDVDIDLSDPEVKKTAFKLQSAFRKKRTSSKNKSQINSTKDTSRVHSEIASNLKCKNMSAGATNNTNRSVIEHANGKGECKGDHRNQHEVDVKMKGTRHSLNKTLETNGALVSSLTCGEHDNIHDSSTNNDITKARPQSLNTNTDNLVSTSSKQTEGIDIDLNDDKVKEATKKIQNIFKRKKTTTKKTAETPGKGESKKPVVRLKSNAAISLGSKHQHDQTKPMVSTSFLDHGEQGRKETKASIVSPDCHDNADDDEGMKRASNRCDVGELEKTNGGLVTDSNISDPRGDVTAQTELQNITEDIPLSSNDEHVSSKTDSTSATTPSIQRDDDDGNTTAGDINDSAQSGPDQSSLDEGAKGDKFNLDNNGSRPVSSLHYADVGPFAMPPASSTASLLRMQDEFDIDNLMTAHVTNGHITNNGPATSYLTSLTTAPLNRRTRDRDDDVDSMRLKSTSTTGIHGKALHGFIDQTSDDTEYETAYSDFSDRVDDELERTLIQEEVISTKQVQMENTIHHHSPRFLIRPKNASCYHGDRTRFVCCITGSPRPDISWFAAGKVVRPERNNRLHITDYSEDGDGDDGNNACALVSILEIVEVKFLDNGEYACVAINSKGQAFSSAHLKVETQDPGPADESTRDEYNRLSEDSKNETSLSSNVNVESSLQDLVSLSSSSLPRQKVQALVGSKSSFFCPVEGDPLPDVRWFKDDIPIICNHGDDRIAIRVEGCIHCLYIRDILLSDEGTYVCSAANDRGTVLCVSFLEVQESSVSTDGNQQIKQRTPMLVITDPDVFRQPTFKPNPIVSLQTNKEETVVPLDSSNIPHTDVPNHRYKTSSDEDCAKMVRDGTTEYQNNGPQINMISGVATDRITDEILSSALSTYGPRESPHNDSGDRLSTLSNDVLVSKESNSSENYASAEGPPSDDDDQLIKNKFPNGSIPSECDSLTETKHHKGSKRRSSRRNHVKSPSKTNHSASPGDITEVNDLDDVNGLSRNKSSRKKRSSSRRKKSPLHSRNVERVRLDLEKAEELTEKVDSCLDIIDDLLTLTSYDENENETEEKLRQKLDTLVKKFADTESDAGSLSSRKSTPSHRRKERLRKVDLLNMSDSTGDCLDGSDVNLNVSKIHSDGNIWGPSSLEDSLKVMSDLVGNISLTVRDPGVEAHGAAQANSAESVVNGREENVNNNNNIHRKGLPSTGPLTGQSVKRTPLSELLKHSLFSQDLMTTRVRRRPLPVTRSLDSVDDSVIPCTADGRRRHSFGTLYAPRTTRPSRHPLLRTLSIMRRNRAQSTESSSSDDDNPGRIKGVNVVRRHRRLYTGQVSDDCPSHAESTDSLSDVDQEDKFQQFPDGDRLSSPVGFGDSDSSLEEHHLPDANMRTRLADNGICVSTECLSEYAAVQSAPEQFTDIVGEDVSSTMQHRKRTVGQSMNDIKKLSEQYSAIENGSHHGPSSKAVDITKYPVSRNKDRDLEEEEGHHGTLLNVSRNDSGFSSGVSPMLTDRVDRFF